MRSIVRIRSGVDSARSSVCGPIQRAPRLPRRTRGYRVFAGGIIPTEDEVALKEKGVKGIFTPGATTTDIIAFVQSEIEGREPDAA